MRVEVGEQMVRVSYWFPPCGSFNLLSHLVAINLHFHHSCSMSYPICRLRHREHEHCIMGHPRRPFRTGLIRRITRAEDLGLQIPVWARQQTLQGVEGPAPFSQSFAHLLIILGVLHLWPAGTHKPSDRWEGNRRKKRAGGSCREWTVCREMQRTAWAWASLHPLPHPSQRSLMVMRSCNGGGGIS